jgi:heme-degrading monooxygenase HmoA
VFSVLFEVYPKPDKWDAYLGQARVLKPELEKIDGFVDNIRYRSLTREGCILSLSSWRDEKALVRWRTHAGHHVVQEKGRFEIFQDYRLRVGEVTRDTESPDGDSTQQRLDETQTGDATTIILIDGKRPPDWVKKSSPHQAAEWLGLKRDTTGLVAWDVFDAVLTPGDIILLMAWRDRTYAEVYESAFSLHDGIRLRRVRIVRDYGMFDRREAPQYYPEISRNT